MDIVIKDKVIEQAPKIAKRICIDISRLKLHESVTVNVIFYSGAEDYMMEIVDEKQIEISGEEYTNWGNDDTYLETLVFQKLGIEKA